MMCWAKRQLGSILSRYQASCTDIGREYRCPRSHLETGPLRCEWERHGRIELWSTSRVAVDQSVLDPQGVLVVIDELTYKSEEHLVEDG